MKLLPIIPKIFRSISDIFKIHRKLDENYWKDFNTRITQFWADCLIFSLEVRNASAHRQNELEKLDFLTNKIIRSFSLGTKNAVLSILPQLFCPKGEIIPLEIGEKNTKLFFFSNIFWYRHTALKMINEVCEEHVEKKCWKSENFPLILRTDVESNFFPGIFSSKTFFWTRKTQIPEDCRKVFVRCVKIFGLKCTKKRQKNIFLGNVLPSNNFPDWQNGALAKYTKNVSLKVWYLQNPQ